MSSATEMRLGWGWCRTVKRQGAVSYHGPPTFSPTCQACFCNVYFSKQRCVWVWVELNKNKQKQSWSPPMLVCLSGGGWSKGLPALSAPWLTDKTALEYHREQSNVSACAGWVWEGLGCTFISISCNSDPNAKKKSVALKCLSLFLCSCLVLLVQLFRQLCCGLAQRPIAVKNNTSLPPSLFVLFSLFFK